MSLIDLVRQIHDASHCERDGFPIVLIDGEPRCSVEYADGLIGGQKVIGVADGEQGVEILFANRYSIPLTKPASGEPLIARAGMLPELRALLIGRTVEGFRHGEWVGDGVPPERHPIFALQFSGEEEREHRTIEVSLESVRRINRTTPNSGRAGAFVTATDGVIYHIAERDRWRAALEAGEYHAGSLETEGFIHCSLHRQVLPVADNLYHGQRNLILLEIDPGLVDAEIRHEGDIDRFPHIYGPLNLNAVLRTADFPPGADGRFAFPTELA